MFDFIGTLFHKIIVSVGIALVSIGGTLGGTTQQSIQQPEPESNIATTSDSSANKIPVQTQAVSGSVKTQNISKPSSVQTATLQIESVGVALKDGKATITWSTTIPSESRILLDNGSGGELETAIESSKGFGTSHQIQFVGVAESQEYKFKITATTEDKKGYDDYYGSVVAPKKYTARLGTKEKECQIIFVTDTAGKIAASKTIEVRGWFVTPGNRVPNTRSSFTTDGTGKVKYCETGNSFEVTGDNLDITLP